MKSNVDAGDGYADIIVTYRKAGKAFVIEFKNASSEKELDKEIENAFNQIEKKNYVQAIQDKDINEIYLYAVSCFDKKCKIEMKKIQKNNIRLQHHNASFRSLPTNRKAYFVESFITSTTS